MKRNAKIWNRATSGNRGEGQASLSHRLQSSLKRNGLLGPGERVGVAVSGGADSVALLRLLFGLRERLGIVLSVAHFDHQLRGKASEGDAKFVAELAEGLGLPFHIARADIGGRAKKNKENVEATARAARLGFFAKLAAQGSVDKIATAHTADDQAETVLGHLLRGSGLAGLSGIHPAAGTVVRPLLEFRRDELWAYLRGLKQPWREDATNRDTTRLRARIRKKLLPMLEWEFQPAVVEHLASLAELAREDEAVLNRLAAERLGTTASETGSVCVDVEVLRRELATPALAGRIVRMLARRAKRKEAEWGAKHVEAVLNFARESENGKTLELPGVNVRRVRDKLEFHMRERGGSGEKNAEIKYEYMIDFAGANAEVCIPETGCVLRFRTIDWPTQRRETKIGQEAVLDGDRLRAPLVLRNWRPGDRLRPAGRQHTHKLKELLSEQRVSKWERAGWPVLTSGGEIAWARGFAPAAKFAADGETVRAVLIAEEKL